MPLGLRVNDHLYIGNLTGADPVSSALLPDAPGQLRNALSLLRRAMEGAGLGLADMRRVMATVADQADGEAVEDTLRDSLRGAYIGTDVGPLPPGYLVRLDAFAAHRDDAIRPQLLLADRTPAGVRIGDVMFSPSITAANPETGEVVGDTATQLRAAFTNLDRVLAGAELGRDSILRISGFLRDLGEKDVLNAAMVQAFPDATRKPVHKYVPAVLPPGINVSLQVIARDGENREILEIDGIKHNDPISLGARVGNLVVSSRVQGRLAENAESQAEQLVDSHARRVLQHIGGDLQHLTQAVWGIGDPSYADDVARVMERHWPSRLPDIRYIEADFPHSGLPRLEFIALLDERSAANPSEPTP